MIQVCSGCGTRWNVREKQRTWCPRCNGTLQPPQAEAPPQWSPPGRSAGPQLPTGYRWIAVRPGAPPPPRRQRRPLSPTPRYAAIPRWGLVDQVSPAVTTRAAGTRRAPSPTLVRATLLITVIALGAAAAAHALRYVLMLINRTTLLHPLIAGVGLWLGIVAAVIASVATAASAAVLTWWLIARRSAAFAHLHLPETRNDWVMMLGCLLPPWIALTGARTEAFVLGPGHHPTWVMSLAAVGCALPLLGLLWPLTYLTELARIEGQAGRLGKPIWKWAVVAFVGCAAAVFATVTSIADDAQGIADNTVATTLAYGLVLLAVLAGARIYDGFELRPVHRPAHRWVVMGARAAEEPAAPVTVPEPAAPDPDPVPVA